MRHSRYYEPAYPVFHSRPAVLYLFDKSVYHPILEAQDANWARLWDH